MNARAKDKIAYSGYRRLSRKLVRRPCDLNGINPDYRNTPIGERYLQSAILQLDDWRKQCTARSPEQSRPLFALVFCNDILDLV